jgi:outer membrane protein TolC
MPGYNFTRVAGISPWMPGLNLDFLLPTGGKRGLRQAVARAEAQVARLAVFTTAWQVRSDLRTAYADLSGAISHAGAAQAQTEAQRALVKLLEERFAAGSIAATELSLARIALLRADSAAVDARSQQLTASARVAAGLGLPAAALDGMEILPLPSVAPLSSADIAAARTAALQARADVLAALAKYASANAALNLEAARRTPDFHAGPGYQWDQGANKWTLALAFELPLFHRNEAVLAEVTARRTEAAAQFNLVQAQAIAAIDSAVAAQRAADVQLQVAEKLRAEVRQHNARVRQRLELGGADQVELHTADIETIAAETAVLDAEHAVRLASGQLEDALQITIPHLSAVTDSLRP